MPTEAEWEYVQENPQGVLDMTGREWTNDWHGTVWFFSGGLGMSNWLPFKMAKSTDSGATWQMVLPLLTAPAGDYNIADLDMDGDVDFKDYALFVP